MRICAPILQASLVACSIEGCPKIRLKFRKFCKLHTNQHLNNLRAARTETKNDSTTKALQPIDLQLDEREDGSPPALNTYQPRKVRLSSAELGRPWRAYGHTH